MLQICRKILERLILNEFFRIFIESDLISSNQSSYEPGESCTNLILSVTHRIYNSFDGRFEVRGAFLDISKAFDKVWCKGIIIFKLKQNCIFGKLVGVLSNFLKERHGQLLTKESLSDQFWVLLFFLVYIDDLADGLSSNTKLFALF